MMDPGLREYHLLRISRNLGAILNPATQIERLTSPTPYAGVSAGAVVERVALGVALGHAVGTALEALEPGRCARIRNNMVGDCAICRFRYDV